MSASYGRPQPRRVNAFFDPGQPSAARGIDRQVVNVTPNGRLADYTSVEIAGANAERGFNELANFIEKTVQTAKPIYEAYLKNEVDKELGMVAAQPEMVQAYRNGDEKSKAWISRFRPQTQFYVNQQAAEAGALAYRERYSAIASTDPVLTDSTSTEEQLQKARTAAKNKAFQESGLGNVTPQALGAVSGLLQQVDQVIKVNLATLRDKDAKEIQDSEIVDGVGAALIKAPEVVNQPAAQSLNPNDSVEERARKYRSARTSWWNEYVKTLEENRTSTEAAELFFRGAIQMSTRAFGSGKDIDIAYGFSVLDEAQFVAENENIKTGNGQILGNVVVTQNGKTLREVLAERRLQLEPLREKAEADAALASVVPRFKELMQVSPGEAVVYLFDNLRNSQGEQDLGLLSQVFGTISNLLAAGRAPTNDQLLRQADFEVRLRSADSKAEKLGILNEAKTADLTPRQVVDLAGLAGGGDDESQRLADAERFTSEAREAYVTQLEGDGKFGEGQAEVRLLSRAKEIQEKKVQDFVEASKGIPPSRDEFVQLYRESLEEAATQLNTEVKGDGTDSAPPLTPIQRLDSELGTIRQNITRFAEEGKPTNIREVFSPEFREQARKAGVEDTYPKLLKYFIETLGRTQTKKGEPAYPNPSDIYFKMKKEAEQEARAGGFDSQATQRGKYSGPTRPSDLRNTKTEGDQASIKPLEFVGNAFAYLVGGRPAVAGTLEGKPGVENPDALDELAAVVAGKQDVSLRTPALPQAPANAPAQTVPAQIKTDTHPFFLAIGINEGTRTANGGYTKAYYGHTDPGNGARNVGTISSQQHSNPEVADRVYAGRLSALATRLTPKLMQMGLPTGTVAFNRLMFNLLDLTIQAPLAADDLLGNLKGDYSIEGIAKARADSFINPVTGRLEAGGFGNSYNRLFTDQRSRAGAFDYKARF